jgi:hypothetical protein
MDNPNLHDATLLDLSVQWGEPSTLTARFQRSDRQLVLLKVSDLKLLHCPSREPLGAKRVSQHRDVHFRLSDRLAADRDRDPKRRPTRPHRPSHPLSLRRSREPTTPCV